MNTRPLGALLACLLVSCADEPLGPRVQLQGDVTLHYRVMNAMGAAVVEGTLDFTVHADSTISGAWAIDWAPGADRSTPVGPQIGSGALVGITRPDTTLSLDLNPEFRDNNVILQAAATRTGVSGAWSWIGFAGDIAHGLFTATFERKN